MRGSSPPTCTGVCGLRPILRPCQKGQSFDVLSFTVSASACQRTTSSSWRPRWKSTCWSSWALGASEAQTTWTALSPMRAKGWDLAPHWCSNPWHASSPQSLKPHRVSSGVFYRPCFTLPGKNPESTLITSTKGRPLACFITSTPMRTRASSLLTSVDGKGKC